MMSERVVPVSTEVVAARRRQFSGEYKRRVLDEVDRARPGEIGLILRREGLYSSQLASWRKWRSGMTTRKQNPGKDVIDLAAYRQLEKENAKLKLKLRKAEAMLELQKKALALLDEEDEPSDGSNS
jgi:transposase